MTTLKSYFFWFFLICLVMTFVCGIVSALLPQGMGIVLTVVPYLVAMIATLFIFIKQQRRAPTQAERKKITLGLMVVYWLFNLSFLVLGIVYASRSNPTAWQDFMLYLQQPTFMSIVTIMFMTISIPLYILTYWFYGPQAQRIALKKYGKDESV